MKCVKIARKIAQLLSSEQNSFSLESENGCILVRRKRKMLELLPNCFSSRVVGEGSAWR